VDAQWVERAMELVNAYLNEVADDYDPSEARMEAACQALRTHLSTALRGVSGDADGVPDRFGDADLKPGEHGGWVAEKPAVGAEGQKR
jgi:hypothetical protein